MRNIYLKYNHSDIQQNRCICAFTSCSQQLLHPKWWTATATYWSVNSKTACRTLTWPVKPHVRSTERSTPHLGLKVLCLSISAWRLQLFPPEFLTSSPFLLGWGKKQGTPAPRGSQVLRSKTLQNEVYWGKGGSTGTHCASAGCHIPGLSRKQESGKDSACLKLFVLKRGANIWYGRDQELPKNA